MIRGTDWTSGNADGNDIFEAEKAKRDKEKRLSEEEEMQGASSETKPSSPDDESIPQEEAVNPDPADPEHRLNPAEPAPEEVLPPTENSKKKKKKKIPSPRLPVGTVLSVEPWNGVPALARRVRWHLTGEEGIYRFGADGGRYDICHVETNQKQTRLRKKFQVPESFERKNQPIVICSAIVS